MTYEQMQILNELVSKFKEKQVDVCIEEMSELTQALCKYKRGKLNIDNLTEELADVHIMLMQMLLFFEIDSDVFLETVDKKINRTKERLLNND